MQPMAEDGKRAWIPVRGPGEYGIMHKTADREKLRITFLIRPKDE